MSRCLAGTSKGPGPITGIPTKLKGDISKGPGRPNSPSWMAAPRPLCDRAAEHGRIAGRCEVVVRR